MPKFAFERKNFERVLLTLIVCHEQIVKKKRGRKFENNTVIEKTDDTYVMSLKCNYSCMCLN